MAMWILILALIGADGFVRQIEAVPTPFATREACNDAGVFARADLPVLTPPGPWQRSAWHRIDWVCVATGPVKTAREVCAEREASLDRLREAVRRAAEATDNKGAEE